MPLLLLIGFTVFLPETSVSDGLKFIALILALRRLLPIRLIVSIVVVGLIVMVGRGIVKHPPHNNIIQHHTDYVGINGCHALGGVPKNTFSCLIRTGDQNHAVNIIRNALSITHNAKRRGINNYTVIVFPRPSNQGFRPFATDNFRRADIIGGLTGYNVQIFMPAI